VPCAKVPCEKKIKREERKSLLRVVAGIFIKFKRNQEFYKMSIDSPIYTENYFNVLIFIYTPDSY